MFKILENVHYVTLGDETIKFPALEVHKFFPNEFLDHPPHFARSICFLDSFIILMLHALPIFTHLISSETREFSYFFFQ